MRNLPFLLLISLFYSEIYGQKEIQLVDSCKYNNLEFSVLITQLKGFRFEPRNKKFNIYNKPVLIDNETDFREFLSNSRANKVDSFSKLFDFTKNFVLFVGLDKCAGCKPPSGKIFLHEGRYVLQKIIHGDCLKSHSVITFGVFDKKNHSNLFKLYQCISWQ